MLKSSSFIWNGAFKRAGIKLLLWESKEIQLTVFSGLGVFLFGLVGHFSFLDLGFFGFCFGFFYIM